MVAEVHLHLHLCPEEEECYVIPPDEELIQGDIGETIRITRHCFFMYDKLDRSRTTERFLSFPWRLFDRGRPILRVHNSTPLVYHVSLDDIRLCMIRIVEQMKEVLLDERNSLWKKMLFCVICSHLVSPIDEGDDGLARILQQSMDQSAERFVWCPASREAVASLERTTVDGSLPGDCAICLVELSPDVEQTRMPCRHVFHRDCIGKWLDIGNSCPLCRFTLP